MFIEITNPANPLRTENFLRPYKRGEQPFTPEVAREVLTMTNHKKNIYDTLQLIAEQPNQADYKDIILSAFDHREQPDETIILGKKLAVANDFEDELNNIINNRRTTSGIVYASAANQASYICRDEIPDPAQYPENCTLYCTSSYVDLSDTDLSSVKSLKFKERAEVCLRDCKNLPADLDVSMCDNVNLYNTDLSPVQALKFKEGAKVDLRKCENFPETLDVSMCSGVDLCFTDLSSVKSLKFKEGAEVDLNCCYNLPADLDVSMCDDVVLSQTDLAPVKSLKFKEGSIVRLSHCKNFPEKLDVSMCNYVNLHKADLSSVKFLKLKNQTQKEQSKLEIPDNWQGKIIYTDDIQSANAFAYATQNTGR